jgi:DeoR/GlpR family transcriptional regulator of sugar metabolism
MSETQHQIIELLKKDRFVSAYGISILTQLSLVEIQQELSILEKENKIRYMPFKNDKGNQEKAYYYSKN